MECLENIEKYMTEGIYNISLMDKKKPKNSDCQSSSSEEEKKLSRERVGSMDSSMGSIREIVKQHEVGFAKEYATQVRNLIYPVYDNASQCYDYDFENLTKVNQAEVEYENYKVKGNDAIEYDFDAEPTREEIRLSKVSNIPSDLFRRIMYLIALIYEEQLEERRNNMDSWTKITSIIDSSLAVSSCDDENSHDKSYFSLLEFTKKFIAYLNNGDPSSDEKHAKPSGLPQYLKEILSACLSFEDTFNGNSRIIIFTELCGIDKKCLRDIESILLSHEDKANHELT